MRGVRGGPDNVFILVSNVVHSGPCTPQLRSSWTRGSNCFSRGFVPEFLRKGSIMVINSAFKGTIMNYLIIFQRTLYDSTIVVLWLAPMQSLCLFCFVLYYHCCDLIATRIPLCLCNQLLLCYIINMVNMFIDLRGLFKYECK